MSLTIHKTIAVENLMTDDNKGTLIKEIVEKHRPSEREELTDFQAQAIYDDIARLDGWAEPAEDRSETALDYFDRFNTATVVMNDERKAGLVIYKQEGLFHVQLFKIRP